MYQNLPVNVLYISNLDPQVSVGYNSKTLGQAKGLAKDKVCGLITFNLEKQVIIRYVSQFQDNIENIYVVKPKSQFLILRRIYLLTATLNIISKHKKSLHYLYFRYPRSDPFYILFLAINKILYPHLTIFCEFPTFPYDQEKVSDNLFKSFLIVFLDRLTRVYLKFFIFKAIAINYYGNIFGIPSISIQNGIIVEDFPLRKPQYDQSAIHLLGVANVQNYHGYDRVIAGISKYYEQSIDKTTVYFHIVGLNLSSNTLTTLSKQLGIDEYVLTYPPMLGENLDQLFNLSDLAISTLAAHRIGLNELSPLKSREYCARGIPFILGYKDLDFPSDFCYCKRIEESDIQISIPNLIKFAQQMRKDIKHPFIMRDYAKKNLDWSIKMPNLADY